MANNQNTKITLYWLEKSRAQRVLWLLEELRLEYEVKTYKRQESNLAPPELKKIHPLGKAPILVIESDARETPLVLAESGNMIEYLIDHYGSRLAPKKFSDGKEGQVGGETESWLRYRYYMHYAEGTMMIYLVLVIVLGGMLFFPLWTISRAEHKATAIRSGAPFFLKPIANLIAGGIETKFLQPNLNTNFDFLESQISSSPNGGKYLCGSELSGADIIMSFPLSAAKGRAKLTKQKYPNLCAYVDRLEAFESHGRAVQKIIDIEGSYNPTL
ncbi:hypothetical protein MMC07_008575 [Pseudocyphellaria aurata]|nr:hypothetical protein [Pseudocyphellaria aurata]